MSRKFLSESVTFWPHCFFYVLALFFNMYKSSQKKRKNEKEKHTNGCTSLEQSSLKKVGIWGGLIKSL